MIRILNKGLLCFIFQQIQLDVSHTKQKYLHNYVVHKEVFAIWTVLCVFWSNSECILLSGEELVDATKQLPGNTGKGRNQLAKISMVSMDGASSSD